MGMLAVGMPSYREHGSSAFSPFLVAPRRLFGGPVHACGGAGLTGRKYWLVSADGLASMRMRFHVVFVKIRSSVALYRIASL